MYFFKFGECYKLVLLFVAKLERSDMDTDGKSTRTSSGTESSLPEAHTPRERQSTVSSDKGM